MGPRPDLSVRLVGADGEPDMTVGIVGDQVVDLSDASEGDLLRLESGLLVPVSPLEALEGWDHRARQASDVSVVSNASTFTDLPSLGFPLGIGEVWGFEVVLFYEAATTGDIRVTWAGSLPANADGRWSGIGPALASGSSTTYSVGGTTQGIGSSLAFGGGGAGTEAMVTLRGLVRGATAAGTLQLKMRQGTSDATASIVKADSHIFAKRVS